MSMDINVVREVVTVVSFVSFVGIVAWTLDPRKRERFEEAARLPLEDGEGHE
jgi:cytochrome c oxidase cbb3-type subunit IV